MPGLHREKRPCPCPPAHPAGHENAGRSRNPTRPDGPQAWSAGLQTGTAALRTATARCHLGPDGAGRWCCAIRACSSDSFARQRRAMPVWRPALQAVPVVGRGPLLHSNWPALVALLAPPHFRARCGAEEVSLGVAPVRVVGNAVLRGPYDAPAAHATASLLPSEGRGVARGDTGSGLSGRRGARADAVQRCLIRDRAAGAGTRPPEPSWQGGGAPRPRAAGPPEDPGRGPRADAREGPRQAG